MSAAPHISDDLKRFITTHIDSISHIEALLLLRESYPKAWSAQTLADRIYVHERLAGAVLTRLRDDGLASLGPDGYCFGCDTPQKEVLVKWLAEAYRTYLIPVTNLIHNKPPRIQEFADAFRLRRDR